MTPVEPRSNRARTGGRPRRLAPWIALACLILVGSIAAVGAWSNSHPRNFGVVVEGKIYRSGRLTPSSLQRIADEHHIRTIIDLGAYPPESGEEAREQRTAEALGLTRFVLRLEGDATGNPNYYVQALRIMNEPARQPVLVHCSAGTQRTGCVVMLQRHVIEGKRFNEAFGEAREHQHDPGENPQLLLMLADWADKIGESYRTGQPIPGVDAVPEARPVK